MTPLAHMLLTVGVASNAPLSPVVTTKFWPIRVQDYPVLSRLVNAHLVGGVGVAGVEVKAEDQASSLKSDGL